MVKVRKFMPWLWPVGHLYHLTNSGQLIFTLQITVFKIFEKVYMTRKTDGH